VSRGVHPALPWVGVVAAPLSWVVLLIAGLAIQEAGCAPSSGLPIMAGEKQVGTLGSTAKGRGLALMRLDRIADALAANTTLEAGGVAVRAVKPSWAKFDWPGEAKAIS